MMMLGFLENDEHRVTCVYLLNLAWKDEKE